MTELKPCPFCGGEPKVTEREGFAFFWCGECAASSKIAKESEAREYWNTRPAEDALKAEGERLKAEIEKLKEAIKEIRNIADAGLDIGIDFIGAGLDGMTGGVEEFEDMRRARRKVRRLAKQALKNNNPDTEKGGDDE